MNLLVFALCVDQSTTWSTCTMQVGRRFIENTNHAKKAHAFADALRDPMAPSVIIVRESREDYLGMVARNLLNFGIARLQLVDCQGDHLRQSWLASGAADVLLNAELHPTLEAACRACDVRHVFAVMPPGKHDLLDGGQGDGNGALNTAILSAGQAALETVRLAQRNESEPMASGEVDQQVFAGAQAWSGVAFLLGASQEELALLPSIALSYRRVSVCTHAGLPLELPQVVNILGYESWKSRWQTSFARFMILSGCFSTSAFPARFPHSLSSPP